MEFDIKRVYTAVNADEVKVGSKVIVADSLFQLKDCTYRNVNVREISEIRDDDNTNRFGVGDWENGYQYYPLCYLVSEPEEKKLEWTDLKIGDVIRTRFAGGYRIAIVIRIDTYLSDDRHIAVYGQWLSDDDLEEWEKVE